MKNRLKGFLTLCLALFPVICTGQAKIYTKKAKLQDFCDKTTKVVISSNSIVELNFKKEISARWIMSPYEFCSIGDYENLKEDNSYYFLRLTGKDGIMFLSLSKGGKSNDPDLLKRPVEVVQIPVGSQAVPNSEFEYAGFSLDIMQRFVSDAIKSDRTGYIGLKSYNLRDLSGKRIVLDQAEAMEHLNAFTPDVVVPVFAIPSGNNGSCYKMLVSTDMHELYYYDRRRYRKPSDAGFSKLELDSFKKRGGEIY